MSAQLLGLHQPGTTWLHRLPAGAKLLGLMAASLVVVLVHGPASAVVFVLVAAGLVVWSGARLGFTLRAMRWLLLTAAILGGGPSGRTAGRARSRSSATWSPSSCSPPR